MRFIRWLVNFLAGTVMAIVGLYLVIVVCIVFFKLTGQLTDGVMYFDMQTPGYPGLLIALAAGSAVVWGCLALRTGFGQKDDLAFLRRGRKTGTST